MAFIKITSPHAHRPGNTGTVMSTVILACVPGLIALTVFFGFGSLVNVLLASIFCVGFEAAVLKLRQRKLQFYLRDYSALLTGILLGISLPPFAPWWLVLVACFFAIVVAKQLYGGLGFNPFNPAMIGYVVVLISFPLEMTTWLPPNTVALDGHGISFLQGLQQAFTGSALTSIDGFTSATPLDVFKQNNSLLVVDLYQDQAIFSRASWAGAGWEWVNIAFLLGGVALLIKKIFTWHAPLSMLATLAILSALFYDGGSSASAGSPLFHLLSGGTMFGAFFIVTDPVTSATSIKGRIVYGCGIGLLIFVIRVWGNYPDAIAFSVLLMNFAAPFIDYYTKPTPYGQSTKT